MADTLRFRVAAGSCLDCAGDLSGTLQALPGAREVKVLSGADVITVTHDGRLDTESVRQAAARHNLTLVAVDQVSANREKPWWHDRFVLTMAAAAMLLAGTLVCGYVVGSHAPITTAFGISTIVVGGSRYLREAWQTLRARQLAFVQLLVLAVAGAVVLGVVTEAAMLVVVYSLGEVLEAWVAHRARRSLRSLMDLVPPTARRKTSEGADEIVGVRELSVGDHILVRPGERVPTDGTVCAGASAVDQSAVTGESIPVEVTAGSEVFGGTVNGTGALEIEVSRPYEDTTLAQVVRQVEDAQANKGSAQRFADRFGTRYTPIVVAIAVAVAIAGPILTGDVREWIYRALVVLVVSCSCALIISVPTAVVAAITRGARDGILIRGGAFLEALATVRTVAFDKTGTLTQGRPRLTDVLPLGGHSDTDVLRLAASVEAASEHPLAAAILAGATQRGLSWTTATNVRAEPGVGVHAQVGAQRLFVGRPDKISNTVDGPLASLRSEGKTVVALTRDDRPLGLLAVADQLRPHSRRVIAHLHQLGVQRVVMLTGDHQQVAEATSRGAGVDEWRAQLLPQDKSAVITELARTAGPVAMVGDGINDAPALALADVGIAMGASGSTIALETADVALMADELDRLPAAIQLARRAMRIVRQNVALSLAAIIALVVSALGGLLSLTTGLLLNEGTALLIIANGLRLLRPGGYGPDEPARPTGVRNYASRMPQRSTPFQAIVRLVRQHFAQPGVTVTESKMLCDAVLDIEREVDIVIEGEVDGEPVVISVEVVEHSRPASLPWVQQMLRKHRDLPTNRLLLVSKTGFSRYALEAIDREAGRVQAVTPEVIEVDGEAVVKRFFVDTISYSPTRCRAHVRLDGDERQVVVGQPLMDVHAEDGTLLGPLAYLVQDTLGLDGVRLHLLLKAHKHPQKDQVKAFSINVAMPQLGYHLLHTETKTPGLRYYLLRASRQGNSGGWSGSSTLGL